MIESRPLPGDDDRKPVAVVGVHISSDAYPNVKYKVQCLLRDPSLDVREINYPLSYIQRLGRSRRTSFWNAFTRLRSMFRFTYAHLRVLVATMVLDRPQNVYVPYPAVFVLFLWSLLPRRWRPDRVCADVFISLYDTIVNDRGLLRPRHILARILYAIEKRAYRIADHIIADTELNARYLSRMFRLDSARVAVLPLSIDESSYSSSRYILNSQRCEVLFVGTFVPLQGVDTIARAIVLLRPFEHIHFRLIGDGQTAKRISEILTPAYCKNVSWERGWQNSETLAEAIRQADICLGIFGEGEKARRVWPLKNYAYMSVGRAIITGDTETARAMIAESGVEPFMLVPTGSPDALARAIKELSENPDWRVQYAEASAAYYRKNLAAAISCERLREMVSARP